MTRGVGADGTDPASDGQDPSVSMMTDAAPAAQGSVENAALRPLEPAARRLTLPEIYETCFGYVFTVLRRFGVWERDLEDATHDVFIVVHRRLPDYDPARPLKPWLAGIAMRVASEFRRRAQHRKEVVSDGAAVDAPSTLPSQDSMVADNERRALVLAALERLPFDRRAVLVLHDIEGHAMPDVAFALDTNINTLYARLRTARQELAAAVRQLTAEGGGA
jgi:RNA polymerase sigma-70 factor (ECF subfamily)